MPMFIYADFLKGPCCGFLKPSPLSTAPILQGFRRKQYSNEGLLTTLLLGFSIQSYQK